MHCNIRYINNSTFVHITMMHKILHLMWLHLHEHGVHDCTQCGTHKTLSRTPTPKRSHQRLWKLFCRFFDSIQFVGAIVEYYPFTLWIHPICSGYWLALQTPTEWSGLEGNKLALPMQNSGTRGGSTYKMAKPRVKILHKMVTKNHSVTALRPQI